jgi:FkbM family methyltransferase
MKFNLIYSDRPFSIFIESIVDLAALKEVFLMEEYKWSPIDDPKVIVDLGAHFGDTSLYYHLKFPKARIFAIEPAPNTFKRLLKNIEGIPEITPVQAGIAKKKGVAKLNIVPSSLGNSFKDRAETKESIEVPVHSLRSLFEDLNIPKADIIKFDIEGSEQDLFSEGTPEQFSRAYIGELHYDLADDLDSLIESLKGYVIEKQQLSNPKRFIIRALNK